MQGPVRGQAGSRRVARTAAVAVVALLSVGCNGSDNDTGQTAPRPTLPAPTTTTDPYAIPPVIDAAYVNRVLEGLDAAVGEVVRIVVRTRDVPPEVIDRLKAIYFDREEINLKLASLQDDLRNGLTSLRPNPGNKISRVDEILYASHVCVFARIVRDYTPVGTNTSLQPSLEWIGIKPSDPARDPNDYNPTPWMVEFEGVQADGTEPPSPCVG